MPHTAATANYSSGFVLLRIFLAARVCAGSSRSYYHQPRLMPPRSTPAVAALTTRAQRAPSPPRFRLARAIPLPFLLCLRSRQQRTRAPVCVPLTYLAGPNAACIPVTYTPSGTFAAARMPRGTGAAVASRRTFQHRHDARTVAQHRVASH